MIAAQPPATSAGPIPKGTIRAPFPDRDQPLPEMSERLTAIVRTQSTRPASRAMVPTMARKIGPRSVGSARICYLEIMSREGDDGTRGLGAEAGTVKSAAWVPRSSGRPRTD